MILLMSPNNQFGTRVYQFYIKEATYTAAESKDHTFRESRLPPNLRDCREVVWKRESGRPSGRPTT
jgi:hypothetical protein